ncbi:hypothetical protein QMK19_40585 [Streptomyces sp. H10-C2]|uniref:hypothetical protein n=1 Tax=unclassified Streptomyces TaxID=2593676 RepID=UPI0024B9ED8F|nr:MULTISPECIES: hypothetical protein [unclassified Streptomyces]MDJ0347401.1 hypothetical protein [Streptomyces sp. PH10-H1]MDJ0375703.1 hypothetical protein [Streptomyces sp. H10-C2]
MKTTYPGPEGTWGEQKHDELRSKQAALRNAWSPEDVAELEQLRAERAAAHDALWSHPTVRKAMATGQWGHLHRELKVLAGARGWQRR